MLSDRTIRWVNINGFVACLALFGVGGFIPLFLQSFAGASLFMSGLPLLGLAAGWMVVAVPAGKWVLKYGFRTALIAGNVLLVLAGGLLTLINAESGVGFATVCLTVVGLAFGLTSTVAIIAVQQPGRAASTGNIHLVPYVLPEYRHGRRGDYHGGDCNPHTGHRRLSRFVLIWLCQYARGACHRALYP